jgi:hypothetical protein
VCRHPGSCLLIAGPPLLVVVRSRVWRRGLEIILHRFRGAADARYRPRQMFASDAKFRGPIVDLVIALEADDLRIVDDRLGLLVGQGNLCAFGQS